MSFYLRSWKMIALLCVVTWCMVHIVDAQGPAKPPAIRLYVAPNGNDVAEGSEQAPLATLAEARNKIRAVKKTGALPEGGAMIFVHGGTYELTDAFRLVAEDSGTSAAPVVYRAFPGEKPVLTGSKCITKFVPHEGAIVKADVAAQGFKDHYFRQLFFNGKRQQLARYPNFDPANPYAGGYAYVDGPLLKTWEMYQDKPDDNATTFHYRAKDARTWAHPELGEVSIFPRYNWMNEIVPIAAVDRAARTIQLSRGVGYKAIRPYDRYYVRNLLEELDAPGEWYLDKQTWTLYFLPPEPSKPDSVRAAMTENLVEIGPNASWITVQGFTMEDCDGAAVTVRGSENCVIAGNTIRNVSGRFGPAAVEIQGGRRCGAIGNDISDAENGAIRMTGGDMNALTPSEHYAENNYIHHIGLENGHSCGIWMEGIGQRSSHNLIHDVSRCGIFGGGPDCIIEYNHIRHVNLETEDTGGRYSGGLWHIRGEIIRYNFIHDTLGYGRYDNGWRSPLFSWGIYLDDDQSYTHVYGNIVARTTAGACHVHAGRNNVVENNIFVESSGPQIQYSGHDPKSPLVVSRLKEFQEIQKKPAYTKKYPDIATANLDTIWHMADNKTHRNIIYYRNPKSPLYGIHHVPEDPFRQNEVDANLIWHAGLPLTVSTNGKTLSWQDWQKEGYDVHSVVADPLFVDPDKDDYRLKPESPAFKLGFQPIPVDKIGPYQDANRVSWPIVEREGVRERPLPAARVVLWPDTAPVGDGTRETADSVMTVFLPRPERSTGAAVVICPGGGYIRHCLHVEGPVVAQWLAEHGIAGIVLEYRLPNGRPYLSLLDAQRALRTVRQNAEEWRLDPKRIGILGFSAGGHVASTAGTHFDAGDAKSTDPIERQSCRPDFMMLVYPVVTMGEKTHAFSRNCLLGPNPKPELIEFFSNEKKVTAETPTTFLVHAKDDADVLPENSRALRDALQSHHVPVEYVEFPAGGHGLFGCKGPVWEDWKKKALEWMSSQGIVPRK